MNFGILASPESLRAEPESVRMRPGSRLMVVLEPGFPLQEVVKFAG
jgi:hypothetical protein